jgi:hypothetical protein
MYKNNRKTYGDKISILSIYFFYFALFIIVYKYGISEFWSYAGFIYDFSFGRLFASIVILLFLFPALLKNTLPSDLLINIAIITLFIPTLVLYTCASFSHLYVFITLFAFFIVYIASTIFHPKMLKIHYSSTTQFYIFVAIFSSISIGGILFTSGFKYFNLDLMRVYEFRADASNDLPLIYAYINGIATKCILPFGLSIALFRKEKGYAAMIILGFILFFALTANKSMLFSPIAIISLYFYAKMKKPIFWLLIGMTCILLVSLMEIYLYHSNEQGVGLLFTTFVPRRALLVPAFLNNAYIEFFSTSDFGYWADSKISFGLIDSQYTESLPDVVGRQFLEQDIHANTGWIGSGYAQAGFVGVAIYSILIGSTLAILNSYHKSIDKVVIFSSFAIIYLTIFWSADFLTALLTHSLLFGLLLMMILPRVKKIDTL